MDVDTNSDTSEPVAPFQLLSLHETICTSLTETSQASLEIASFSVLPSIIPDFGVISQSVELLSTGSLLDTTPMGAADTLRALSESVHISLSPINQSINDAHAVDQTSEVVVSINQSNEESLHPVVPLISFSVNGQAPIYPPVQVKRDGPLDSFSQFRQLAEKRSTLESLKVVNSPFPLTGLPDPFIPSIHRSVSSPVFGTTSRTLTLVDSENDNSSMSSKSEKKVKRRKPLAANFPEGKAVID